jgi:hypothetical protein
MKRLCRYCKEMKPFGNEGSMYCPKTKGDNTAKKCKDFKEVK